MTETRGHAETDASVSGRVPDRIDLAVLALKRLAAAFHVYRLYHPLHTHTSEAIGRFLDIHARYAERCGPLTVEVTRSSFFLDFDGSERKDSLLTPLAFSLSTRWVKRLSILEGAAASEVRHLLEILTTPKASVRRGGGAGHLLRERGVQHVAILETATPDDGSAAIESETIRSVLTCATMREETREELRALLQDPEHTARFVETLMVHGTTAADPGVQAAQLYRALGSVDRVIQSTLPRSRPLMFRNVAAAITRLASPAARALRAVIVARAGDDPLAAAMIAAAADEDLRAMFEDTLPAAEPDRKVAAVLALARALSPDRQRITRVLDSLSSMIPSEARTRALETAWADPTPLSVQTALPPEESTDGFRMADEMDARLAMLRALVTLLGAVRPEDARTLFSSMEREVLHLVDEGRLDVLTRVFADIAAAQKHSELDTAHVLLRNLLGRDVLRRLIKGLSPGTLEADQHLWTFFWGLRDDLIPVLLDILGQEERLSVRRMLFTILARVGRDRVSLLVSKLADPNWYIVRNVVGLLGEIRDATTLRYLRRPLLHPEPRVRREVIRVLVEWGSPEALRLLGDALTSGDLETRRLAASWLGASTRPEATGMLLEVVRRRDAFLRDFAVQREAVAALGRVGTEEAFSVLRSLARSPLALISRRHRLLGRDAREALQAIRARTSRPTTGSP